VGTWLDLTGDLEVVEVEALEQAHFLERGLDERLRLVGCASSSRCFGSEPEFAPIRIGIPLAFAARTTSATLSEPPMLPGLMRRRDALVDRLQREARVEVDVGDDRDGREADDLRERLRVLRLRNATRTISQPALAALRSAQSSPRRRASSSSSSTARRRGRRRRS
jgi:hypothetical protein